MKYMAAHETEIYTRLARKNRAAADQYFATCMGQDATMDDETVEKLKAFLKSKLTAEDHEAVCNLLAGDVEAQDTEPPPDDVPRLPGTPRPLRGMDGLSARQRMDAASVKSFSEMFPDAARIKIL